MHVTSERVLHVVSAAAVEDTGAPDSPVPAHRRRREAKSSAGEDLAAAAGIRTGWLCHLFLMDQGDN